MMFGLYKIISYLILKIFSLPTTIIVYGFLATR